MNELIKYNNIEEKLSNDTKKKVLDAIKKSEIFIKEKLKQEFKELSIDETNRALENIKLNYLHKNKQIIESQNKLIEEVNELAKKINT